MLNVNFIGRSKHHSLLSIARAGRQQIRRLRVAVDAIYDRWWIEMRYKRAYSSRVDLELLVAEVDWIDRHYVSLYI